MKTNEHIIKEFEKVNAELREQLKELKAEKQSLEQMFQAQQELLNQRNAVIAELKSELSVKDGLLNIKNGLAGKILLPQENEKAVEEILNVDTECIQCDVHRFGIEYCQKCIRGNDRKKEFDEICDMFNDCMEDYNKSGVIRFLAELTQKLRESGVIYTVESFDGEINVKDIEIHSEEDCEKAICENIPNYESLCRELQDQHQTDCITINQLNVCIDILCDKYSRLRKIHGL